jgi:hypothetical protein
VSAGLELNGRFVVLIQEWCGAPIKCDITGKHTWPTGKLKEAGTVCSHLDAKIATTVDNVEG